MEKRNAVPVGDKLLEEQILKQDKALSGAIKFVSGKYVVIDPKPAWLMVSANGAPYVEKIDFTASDGVVYRVKTFKSNPEKGKPDNSFTHIWYKDKAGKEIKSLDYFVTRTGTKGRNVFRSTTDA